MNKKMIHLLYTTIVTLSIGYALTSCSTQKTLEYKGYLFAYFTGNGTGEEQVRYALSTDGYTFFSLNNGEPVIDSKAISNSGGVRDPHILRGEDGTFYMVLTDLHTTTMGWENTEMILMKSSDLINWSNTIINVPLTYPENFGDVNRVWAPQTIFDQEKGKYMIYWSMRHNHDADIIYYAYANADFTGLEAEPKQLLYKEGACIDGDIVFKDGKYHLFFKNEDEGAKGILKAVSDKINEGYVVGEEYVDQTDDAVEGSGTFKLIGTDKYILMYDVYGIGKYQFCESTDLEKFTVIDQAVNMNFHPRHGSVIPITQDEMDAMIAKWGKINEGVIIGAGNEAVKNYNLVIDPAKGTIYVPVKPGTDLSHFDPQFMRFPNAIISKTGAQDFTKGAIDYTVSLAGESKTFAVTVQIDGNPVLGGYYADPEIIYSERDNKFYLYPTSDGFHGWSGKYFETFSSEDLVNWTNEGVIVDLRKDVSWANRNAWAPAAIEKKVGDAYKYFYYFTAAQKIGVAVSDNPDGPFVDSGRPLVNFRPKGVNGGQEIDPDVFMDPKTGKSYLYWGNGYMAVAELNEDMISIDTTTIKVLTPDATFREGTEMFYRNGTYYFLWSENDTRDKDYRVRYATADSPVGPFKIPSENLVIEKDVSKGIYATGHNSVVYSKAKDQWYIVYHRFNRPRGIDMGGDAGFHREVCIDKLDFNEDGSIQKVQPTLKGILD